MRARPTILLIALALSALAFALPTERLAVQVAPRVGFAPLDVRVRVHLEPKDDDRWLRVEAVSQETSFASEIQLDGPRDAGTRWIAWRGLPAGDYVVVARLASNSGVTAQASTTLTVLGNER